PVLKGPIYKGRSRGVNRAAPRIAPGPRGARGVYPRPDLRPRMRTCPHLPPSRQGPPCACRCSAAAACTRRNRSRTVPRGETMPIEKDVLTTGEVAKICNVAPRTVSKWFDSGSLRGYRIPGSKDRRIPVSELIKFMRAHGIPMDGIVSGRTRVLIVDDEAEITSVLQKVLTEQTNYEVKVASSAFEAGMECERFKPHVVLLDIHIGDGGAGDARMVRSEEHTSELQSRENLVCRLLLEKKKKHVPETRNSVLTGVSAL